MRKCLLSALVILSAGLSSAQTCTPQYADSTFGAWPDTTTNFATAYVGVPYVQLLDFKAPSNASDIDPSINAPIQSYKVTAVNGLPTGFTYNCSASNCEYQGGNAGCAELVGTAQASQMGVHPIEINIQATILLGGFIPTPYPHTFVGYKLIVEEQVLSTSLVAPDEVYIFPNPATSTVSIINAHNYESFEIYGLNGQLITQKGISSSEEKINITDLKEGVYFIHLMKGASTSVHKFVKK